MQSLPFGGVKDSGYGRFAGPEGLRACCLLKSVTVDRFPKIMGTVVPGPLQVLLLLVRNTHMCINIYMRTPRGSAFLSVVPCLAVLCLSVFVCAVTLLRRRCVLFCVYAVCTSALTRQDNQHLLPYLLQACRPRIGDRCRSGQPQSRLFRIYLPTWAWTCLFLDTHGIHRQTGTHTHMHIGTRTCTQNTHLSYSRSNFLTKLTCRTPPPPRPRRSAPSKTRQYPVAKSGTRFAASMTRMFYCTSLTDKIWAVIELIQASVGK